jgi:hypothetical protein
MVFKGTLEVTWNQAGEEVSVIAPERSVVSIPANSWRRYRAVEGNVEVILTTEGDRRKRVYWDEAILAQAKALNRGLDPDGYVSKLDIMPVTARRAGARIWPLFSRLFTFAVLAFLAAIVWPFLRGISQPVNKAPAFGIAAVLAVAMLVSFGWMFKPQTLVTANEPVPVKPVAEGQQQKNWEHWGNTTHGDRFAALDQINKQNINELKVAWVAHTGDIPQSNGSGAEDQNTPLQIGDTLYVCTPYSKVLALDVDSGKEKWRYDSKATAPPLP